MAMLLGQWCVAGKGPTNGIKSVIILRSLVEYSTGAWFCHDDVMMMSSVTCLVMCKSCDHHMMIM